MFSHLHQLWPFFEHPVNNSLTFTKFTNIWQVKITCAQSWCFALQACLVLPCRKIAHHFILQISAQLPLPLDQNQSWDLDIVTAGCPWPLFAEKARLAVVTADEGLGDDHDGGDDDDDTDDQVWAKVIASEQNLLPLQISNWPHHHRHHHHHHRHHHHHHWDCHNGYLHDALLWELQAGHKRRLDRQQEGASLVCAQSVLFLILNH